MPGLWFKRALLPEGWADDVRVEIADGRISSVTAGAKPDGAERFDGVALPGLGNAHSHAFQRGMAGLAERRGTHHDTFWTWRETMYRFALTMSPDDVEAIAAQLYVEMLEAGFTRVGEFHYLHHDRDGRPYANVAEMASRIAAAAEASGIGLTLLPVFYAHSDFGAAPPLPEQRRFICDLDLYARLWEASRVPLLDLPGSILGLAPHSLRAATTQQIEAIRSLAPDGRIHMHIAEQEKEVRDCLAWSKARPVALLLDNAEVGRRWCLVHATHMDDDEAFRLAGSGATVSLCPVTEANLGDGIFDAPRFREGPRPHSHRHGFQYPDRRCRRASAARIFAALARPQPQRHGGGWRLDGPRAVRGGACRRGGGGRDWCWRASRQALPPTSSRSIRTTGHWSGRAATRSSTPGSSQPATRRSIACSCAASRSCRAGAIIGARQSASASTRRWRD